MKKLAKLSPGRIFNFAGEKFVVMEQRDGAAFVLLAQSKESCPFNDKDNAENRNDYTCSTTTASAPARSHRLSNG